MSDRKTIPPEVEAELRAYAYEDRALPVRLWYFLPTSLRWVAGIAVAGAITAIAGHYALTFLGANSPSPQPGPDPTPAPTPAPTAQVVASGEHSRVELPPELLAEIMDLPNWLDDVRRYHRKRSNEDEEAITFWKAFPKEADLLTKEDLKRIQAGEQKFYEKREQKRKAEGKEEEDGTITHDIAAISLPYERFRILAPPGSNTIRIRNNHYRDIKVKNEGSLKAEEVTLEVPSGSTYWITRRGEQTASAQGVSVIPLGSLAPQQEIRVEVWSYTSIHSDFWVQHSQGRVQVTFGTLTP